MTANNLGALMIGIAAGLLAYLVAETYENRGRSAPTEEVAQ